MDLKDSERLSVEGKDYWYFTGKQDLLERTLKRLLKKGNMEILSVGCGVGSEIETLSHYGRVTALDCNEEALRHIPDSHLKIKTRIEESNLNSQYDLVVMLDILEHVSDDRRALQKTLQALKNGGTAVITAPSYQTLYGPHDLALGHLRRYSMNDLRKLLQETGFRDIRLSYWNSLLFPPLALQKIAHRIAGKNKPQSSLLKIPQALNHILSSIIIAENRIRDHLPMPFGITIMATARK